MSGTRASAVAIAVGVPAALIVVAGALAAIAPASATPSAEVGTPSPTPSMAPAPAQTSASAAASPAATASTPDDSMPVDLSAGSEMLLEAPGASGPSDEVIANPNVQVLNRVETDDPVYFITIDDGLNQPQDALDLIREREIPVTAFLTEYAAVPAADYFQEATAYGGSVQNHSMVHGNFSDPKTNVHWEICATQKRYNEAFGYTPWMLRPPYGEGYDKQSVLDQAEECGISRVVLWNVVVTEDNKVQYWDPPIRPGDIVLLHWNDNLAANLETLLQLGEEQGLSPAPLENYI